MVSSEDLQSSLAQFEREIQNVKTSSSEPNQTATLPTTSNKPNDSSQPSGRWKWTGDSWKWQEVTTTPDDSQTPASSSAATAVPHLSTLPSPSLLPAPPIDAAASRNHPVRKRTAAGTVWQDQTLTEWPEADHRLFVGDLAPDVTNAELQNAFTHYPSFNMARTVRDKRTDSCRGYGFVSFGEGEDMIAAMREMNGKYVGTRPIKLKRSNWQKRNLTSERRKQLKLFRNISKP